MSDAVYALEQGLAAARHCRLVTGNHGDPLVESLEAAIEAAKQPRPLGPIFGTAKPKTSPPTPAAPVQPGAGPLPIRVKVTHCTCGGPTRPRERDIA
jgi:hypothetical protein